MSDITSPSPVAAQSYSAVAELAYAVRDVYAKALRPVRMAPASQILEIINVLATQGSAQRQAIRWSLARWKGRVGIVSPTRPRHRTADLVRDWLDGVRTGPAFVLPMCAYVWASVLADTCIRLEKQGMCLGHVPALRQPLVELAMVAPKQLQSAVLEWRARQCVEPTTLAQQFVVGDWMLQIHLGQTMSAKLYLNRVGVCCHLHDEELKSLLGWVGLFAQAPQLEAQLRARNALVSLRAPTQEKHGAIRINNTSLVLTQQRFMALQQLVDNVMNSANLQERFGAPGQLGFLI